VIGGKRLSLVALHIYTSISVEVFNVHGMKMTANIGQTQQAITETCDIIIHINLSPKGTEREN